MLSKRVAVLLSLVAVCLSVFLQPLSYSSTKVNSKQYEFVNITLSDSEGAVFKLTQFLKLRTVSDAQMQESHAQDPEQFHLAHVLLQKAYSSVWRYLDVEKVAEHSLLIKWQGSNQSLDPVLFVSHMDVVPATEGPSSEWSKAPFGGEVSDK